MNNLLPNEECTAQKEKIKSKVIFLAEDDIDDQELIIDAIKTLDADTKVYTISNGNKAVGFLEQLSADQLPNLIVLDYNLPEINGGQILEILKDNQRYNVIPKIVWSTSNSPLYKSQCMTLGAKAYLVKPSDMSGINNMAQQILDFCATVE